MLTKLSLRNAKRQLREYSIYFATITISIAMLYSFNAFIFSNTFQQLSQTFNETDDSGSTYVVIFYSCVIVIVVGWLISYMLNFMLKKRSAEFATYMLMGIEKKMISKLYITENCIIGGCALIAGLFTGNILAKLINIVVISLFGYTLYSQFIFSWNSICLTVTYFCFIYIILLLLNKSKFNKLKLITLLNINRYNEIPTFKNPLLGIILFLCSIFCGFGSFLLFLYQPLNGDYSNISLGFLLIILCQFGICFGICPVFYYIYRKRRIWKKNFINTFVFRQFFAKVKKITFLFGIVASLLSIALLFISTASSYGYSVNKLLDLNTFDISILHVGEKEGLTQYSDYLNTNDNIECGNTYNIYTNSKSNFMKTRNNTLQNYFNKRNLDVDPNAYLYDLNKYDMYICYSDYNMLRKMLGYDSVEMDKNQFMIHCMPYLQNAFHMYNSTLEISGNVLSLAGIRNENFSQYDGYGNGQEFIIVVPDKYIESLKVSYSLYVAKTVATKDMSFLSTLSTKFSNLKLMELNFTEGITGSEEYMTKLSYGNSTDYLTGKYVILSTKAEISLILSLIFLGLLLCIACTVILAVQLLSDNTINSYRYSILHLLGIDKHGIILTLRKQIITYFLLPAIPTILLSIGLVYITVNMIINEYFLVPVLSHDSSAGLNVFIITLTVFIITYCIYILITYLIAKKDILHDICNNKAK